MSSRDLGLGKYLEAELLQPGHLPGWVVLPSEDQIRL